MTANSSLEKSVPWWVRARAPWKGDLFDRTVLATGSPEEERIQTLRQAVLARYRGGKRRLSVAKALISTRSYQETEGLHPALRRAMAMDRVFSEISIALLPGQLLMGTSSSGPHRVDFYGEFLRPSPQSLIQGAETPSPLEGAEKKYVVEPEDRQLFEREIWPYWRTRSKAAHIINEMQRHYPEAWMYLRFSGCCEMWPGGALYHTIQDYASILRRGLLATMEEIKVSIAGLDAGSPTGMSDYDRRNQYEAMLIAADGLLAYARRNAELADSLASEEPNPRRAAELREMARICRKVPAYPAESWWEALQSFHFLRMGTALADGGDSHSAGRFDQYMYPYLQTDLAEGRTTKAKAQELLECLFLKWGETNEFSLNEGFMGVGNNDKINLGGIDGYGRDCTNELSFMLLEAHAHVHLNDPNLSVRVHRHTPDDLLRRTLEVVRLGGGLPILVNDETVIPALVSCCGVLLEHARHYGDCGCQENVTDPNMTGADMNGRTNAGWFSLPKPVELALFDGVNPMNGVQVGPRTGDPRGFGSMEGFLEAVKAQVEHAVEMNAVVNNVTDYVFSRQFPCVFHNLMHPGPRASGIDINAGGCRYNRTGALGVGMANAGDILSAIDNLIFRQRTVSWDRLLAALEHNWEGDNELRRRCISAPKYGCDDEYADGWARTLLGFWFDAYERRTTPRGGHFAGGLISMGHYVTLGRLVGATPDGRGRGEPLADSTAPSSLATVAGPTATHSSVTRAVDGYRVPNGLTFNQRLSVTSVMSPRELSKWVDLVRAYVEAGGPQVQYTVVDGEELKKAQQHPEQYRDLFVRVGGYSALFVDLSKDVQDSIMARTEQGL